VQERQELEEASADVLAHACVFQQAGDRVVYSGLKFSSRPDVSNTLNCVSSSICL
jgi:hypothetical protein